MESTRLQTTGNAKSKKLRIALNHRTLCMLSCIIFFAQDAIRVVIGTVLPIFSSDALTWFMIALMYMPLIAALLLNPSKTVNAVGRFLALLGLIAAFFAVTYLIHPEYHSWFFEGSYKIMNWVFRPNQFIYAFLFISIVSDPEDAIKAMKIAAYFLLAYYTYKLLRARMVGYWITTTTSAGAQRASYDLNYGYDHLLVLSVFAACGFRERKPLYFILAGVSLIEILLGGSRGPLIGVALLLVVMYIHYYKQFNVGIRVLIIGLIILILFIWLFLGFDFILMGLGKFLSGTLGVTSRTLESLLSGAGFLDDNGRGRLYRMAIEMIKEGFWGYGAYGDRYVIGEVYWVGYCHNLFMELLIDFGWIIGGIFCIKTIYASLKMVFACKEEVWRVLFVTFMIPCTKLLFSGSFWYLEAFWACMAVYGAYMRWSGKGGVSRWLRRMTSSR